MEMPKFNDAAEEAHWLETHMNDLDTPDPTGQDQVDALVAKLPPRRGRPPTGAVGKNISINLPEAQIERARALAAKKGVGYQTYLKILITEGLERAEA